MIQVKNVSKSQYITAYWYINTDYNHMMHNMSTIKLVPLINTIVI